MSPNMKKRAITLSIIFILSATSIVSGIEISNNQHFIVNQKQSTTNRWVEIIKPNGGEIYTGYNEVEWTIGGNQPIYPIYSQLYLIFEDYHYIAITDYIESINGTNRYEKWDTRDITDGCYLIGVKYFFDTDYDDIPDEEGGQDNSDDWFTIKNSPDTPAKPEGPTEGRPTLTYEFETNTTDPLYEDLKYLFDWGDGTDSGWIGYYESEEIATAEHKWSQAGTYTIKVKAKNRYGKESPWSENATIQIINNKPEKPLLTGPETAMVHTECIFNVSTTDADNDQIYFYFDWYVGKNSTWIGPFDSNEVCTVSHIFEETGSYIIKVKAKDILGYESEWTEMTIKISNRKGMFMDIIFERLLHRFPLLKNFI